MPDNVAAPPSSGNSGSSSANTQNSLPGVSGGGGTGSAQPISNQDAQGIADAARNGAAGTQKPVQPPPPTPPSRLKRKEMVNGKEVELEASEDDLWGAYRKRTAAEERFQQSAERERKAEAREQEAANVLRTMLKPGGLLEVAQQLRPDMDPLDWISQELQPYLHQKNLDPAQKERLALETRAERAERMLAEREASDAKAKDDFEEKQEMSRLGNEFTQVLPMTGLPVDDHTLRTMAEVYFTNKEQGYNISQGELATAVFEREVERQNAILSKVSGEALLDKFPHVARAIHKALIDRHLKQQQSGGNPAGGEPPRREETPRPPEPERPKLMSDREMETSMGIRRLRTI